MQTHRVKVYEVKEPLVMSGFFVIQKDNLAWCHSIMGTVSLLGYRVYFQGATVTNAQRSGIQTAQTISFLLLQTD